MDLLSIKPIETTTVHLRDPNTDERLFDGKTPVTITLKGMHADSFQSELSRQRAESARNEKRGAVKSAAQERADAARLYAAVTTGWTGITGECTPDNARAIYEPESAFWIRSQISDALLELSARLKK